MMVSVLVHTREPTRLANIVAVATRCRFSVFSCGSHFEKETPETESPTLFRNIFCSLVVGWTSNDRSVVIHVYSILLLQIEIYILKRLNVSCRELYLNITWSFRFMMIFLLVCIKVIISSFVSLNSKQKISIGQQVQESNSRVSCLACHRSSQTFGCSLHLIHFRVCREKVRCLSYLAGPFVVNTHTQKKQRL